MNTSDNKENLDGDKGIDSINNTENATEVVKVAADTLLKTSEGVIKMKSYAKSVLSEEQYNAIGEEGITSPSMTKEKLDVLRDSDLAMEQMIALGGEALAHPKMTSEKITVIGYMLSVDDIGKIGAKHLAEISIEELNEIV